MFIDLAYSYEINSLFFVFKYASSLCIYETMSLVEKSLNLFTIALIEINPSFFNLHSVLTPLIKYFTESFSSISSKSIPLETLML